MGKFDLSEAYYHPSPHAQASHVTHFQTGLLWSSLNDDASTATKP